MRWGLLKGPVQNLGHQASFRTPRHPMMEFAAAANLWFGDKLVESAALQLLLSGQFLKLMLPAEACFLIMSNLKSPKSASISRLVQGTGCSKGSTNAFRNLPRAALSGYRDFWSLSNRDIGVGIISNRRACLVLTSRSMMMMRRLKSSSESITSLLPLTLGLRLRLSNDFTLCLVS